MEDWLQQWLNGGTAPQSSPVQGAAMNQNLAGVGQQTNPLMQSWGQLGALGKVGAVSQGLGAFSSLANIYAGFKALKMQEKQFDFAKESWNKNYNNQVKDYENTLKDRWAARNASAGARGGSYETMGNWVGSRALTGQEAGSAPITHSSAQSFYSNDQPAARAAATPQQKYATQQPGG